MSKRRAKAGSAAQRRLTSVLFTCEVRHARAGEAALSLSGAADEFLTSLRLHGRELSLLLVSDAAIRKLNREHRARDQATDVLSFPQEEPRAARRAKGPIGDVVISLQTALRQSREGGWSLDAELRRLLAHGLLHCLGHDHSKPGEAKRMAAAERRLLGSAGLVGIPSQNQRSDFSTRLH
jgi:probable rRNA maturation factor